MPCGQPDVLNVVFRDSRIPHGNQRVVYTRSCRAGASGPAGPVLAGPILREKVGAFISRLHVGVAARAIVT